MNIKVLETYLSQLLIVMGFLDIFNKIKTKLGTLIVIDGINDVHTLTRSYVYSKDHATLEYLLNLHEKYAVSVNFPSEFVSFMSFMIDKEFVSFEEYLFLAIIQNYFTQLQSFWKRHYDDTNHDSQKMLSSISANKNEKTQELITNLHLINNAIKKSNVQPNYNKIVATLMRLRFTKNKYIILNDELFYVINTIFDNSEELSQVSNLDELLKFPNAKHYTSYFKIVCKNNSNILKLALMLDTNDIYSYLNLCFDFSYLDENNNNALSILIENDKINFYSFVKIVKKIDLSKCNKNGNFVSHILAKYEKYDEIKYLLQNYESVDVNKLNNENKTMLDYVISNKNIDYELVNLIVDCGYSSEHTNKNGQHLLTELIIKNCNDKKLLQKLFNKHTESDLLYPDKLGINTLEHALLRNNYCAIQLLVDDDYLFLKISNNLIKYNMRYLQNLMRNVKISDKYLNGLRDKSEGMHRTLAKIINELNNEPKNLK